MRAGTFEVLESTGGRRWRDRGDNYFVQVESEVSVRNSHEDVLQGAVNRELEKRNVWI